MTPIKEQILFASERLKEAKEQRNIEQQWKWEGYLQALNYAKLW